MGGFIGPSARQPQLLDLALQYGEGFVAFGDSRGFLTPSSPPERGWSARKTGPRPSEPAGRPMLVAQAEAGGHESQSTRSTSTLGVPEIVDLVTARGN